LVSLIVGSARFPTDLRGFRAQSVIIGNARHRHRALPELMNSLWQMDHPGPAKGADEAPEPLTDRSRVGDH
jgi:hypothetical protein